ncbi:Serine proteases trypsin domain [Trinorchestia longiramus]|nr:Serine proteases trypsin domain [Trinorchestia longiramus]
MAVRKTTFLEFNGINTSKHLMLVHATNLMLLQQIINGHCTRGNPGTGGPVTGVVPPRDTGCWCQPVNQVCTSLRPLNLDIVTRIINRPGSPGAVAGVPSCTGDRRLCCAQPGTQIPGQSGPLTSQCGAAQAYGVSAATSPTADFGEYPFMAVVLGPGQTYVAGGALISNSVVLTAAHKLTSPNGLTVRLGDYDVSRANDVPQYPHYEVPVIDVLIHPNYNRGSLANDVALLQLAQPVNLQQYPHIAPAFLPNQGESFTGQRPTTTLRMSIVRLRIRASEMSDTSSPRDKVLTLVEHHTTESTKASS